MADRGRGDANDRGGGTKSSWGGQQQRGGHVTVGSTGSSVVARSQPNQFGRGQQRHQNVYTLRIYNYIS